MNPTTVHRSFGPGEPAAHPTGQSRRPRRPLATVPAAKVRFSGIQFGVSDAVLTALVVSMSSVLAKLLPALRATRIPPSEVARSL